MLHGSRCWIRGLQVLSRMLDAASSCFTSPCTATITATTITTALTSTVATA